MLKIKGISLLVSLSLLSAASHANLFTGSDTKPNEIQKKSWHWFNTEDLNTLSGTEKYRFIKGCFTLTTVCITSFTEVEPIPDGPFFNLPKDKERRVLSEEELFSWNASGLESWDQVLGSTEGDSRKLAILGAQSFGRSGGTLSANIPGTSMGFSDFPASTDAPLVRTELTELSRPGAGSENNDDELASTGPQPTNGENPGDEITPGTGTNPGFEPQPPAPGSTPDGQTPTGGETPNEPGTGGTGGENGGNTGGNTGGETNQPPSGGSGEPKDPPTQEPSGGKKPVLPGDPPIIEKPLVEPVNNAADDKELQVVSEPPMWLFLLMIFIALMLLKDRRSQQDNADAAAATA